VFDEDNTGISLMFTSPATETAPLSVVEARPDLHVQSVVGGVGRSQKVADKTVKKLLTAATFP